jgi:hypothetical protein
LLATRIAGRPVVLAGRGARRSRANVRHPAAGRLLTASPFAPWRPARDHASPATVGGGFLATFDGPARAIRAADAIRAELAEHGLQVRVGLHTGECELLGDDIGGIAVHIAARVLARAGAGELLCSRTVKDLVAGAGFVFIDRGRHRLKGVPDPWRLYAVQLAER